MHYTHTVVGGTFDHFHAGHKKLLLAALHQSHRVTIGLSMPILYQNKVLSHLIQDYETRETAIKKFLTEQRSNTSIVPLTDIFGTMLKDETIDAIFVTEENIASVEIINKKRQEMGWPSLHIVVVPYVMDTHGVPIASERIRKGEIDREGFVYSDLFLKKLVLPENLRATLQKPLGEVFPTTDALLSHLNESDIVIAVGDIIAEALREAGRTAAINIIDLKTRRHALSEKENTLSSKPQVTAQNPQGTIQQDAVRKYQKALQTYLTTKEKQTLLIEGEEDLLALPAILLSPLDSIVLYGQFDEGVVVNKVTEVLKKKVRDILKRFE